MPKYNLKLYEGKMGQFETCISEYKANLRCGKITHKVINANTSKATMELIGYTKNLYNTVSGQPRMYVDNTLELLNSLNDKLSKQ